MGSREAAMTTQRLLPGLVSATFKAETPEYVLEQAVENGLTRIEWSENAHVQPDDAAGAASLLHQTEAAGLRVAAYGSYYRLGEYDKPMQQFQKSLVSASALHAPLMRIWAGVKPSTEADESYRARLASEAAQIAAEAEKAGVKVAFEWHKNTLTDTNESALQLLRDANSANLYCLWQPTVALSMEQRCEGVRLLGDRLLNFHVYYWLDGVRRPLSEGKAEWQRYLAQYKSTNDDEHCALLEFVMNNTAAQFAQDTTALRAILEQAGRL